MVASGTDRLQTDLGQYRYPKIYGGKFFVLLNLVGVLTVYIIPNLLR